MTTQDRPFTPPGNRAARRWIAGILGMLATAVFVPSAGLAREDSGGKMSFDLPADDAERSLKRFSERSGLEVLFISEAAANVRTNAIKGDYTPRRPPGATAHHRLLQRRGREAPLLQPVHAARKGLLGWAQGRARISHPNESPMYNEAILSCSIIANAPTLIFPLNLVENAAAVGAIVISCAIVWAPRKLFSRHTAIA